MPAHKRMTLVLAALIPWVLASSCLGPSGDTVQEKRASALEMRDKALAIICEKYPDVKKEVDESVGYAVFSNFSLHPGLLSFGTGYGVLTNKAKNRETHLKWHRLTIGPGIAVKGLYGLVVFHDQDQMEKFEKGRWVSGGQIEASFVFGSFGGAAEHAWTFTRKADVHYATHTGVALELELFGIGKVSNNSKLNAPPSP
jgi:hypothetical protein